MQSNSRLAGRPAGSEKEPREALGAQVGDRGQGSPCATISPYFLSQFWPEVQSMTGGGEARRGGRKGLLQSFLKAPRGV